MSASTSNVTELASYRRAEATEPGSDGAAEIEDDTLVLRYRAGDQAAFTQLYERYKGPLYRYFLRQTGEAQAQDCFQETWAKLLDTLERYHARGTFQAYLFRIGHNVLMDHFRRDRRFTQPLPELEEPASGQVEAGEALDEKRRLARLYEQIGKLPLAQRSAWLLQQESELSLQEIADLTNATVEAVKSRLRYAKNKLQAGMARHER
ncbi:MAG: sigma-70 family RNA polymerase sigma factor [Pseudomonadota bacterium]